MGFMIYFSHPHLLGLIRLSSLHLTNLISCGASLALKAELPSYSQHGLLQGALDFLVAHYSKLALPEDFSGVSGVLKQVQIRIREQILKTEFWTTF